MYELGTDVILRQLITVNSFCLISVFTQTITVRFIQLLSHLLCGEKV